MIGSNSARCIKLAYGTPLELPSFVHYTSCIIHGPLYSFSPLPRILVIVF